MTFPIYRVRLNMSETKNIPPKALNFPNFMFIFAMSSMISHWNLG